MLFRRSRLIYDYGTRNLVYVFSQPKTASSSVRVALEKAGLRAIQVHNAAMRPMLQHRRQPESDHIRDGRDFLFLLSMGFVPKVVTITRDPRERALSQAFQNALSEGLDVNDTDRMTARAGELLEIGRRWERHELALIEPLEPLFLKFGSIDWAALSDFVGREVKPTHVNENRSPEAYEKARAVWLNPLSGPSSVE